MILDKSNSNKIDGLRILKLVWNKGTLKARIVWNPSSDLSKYTVTWWSSSSDGPMNAFNHFKFAAMTKVNI